jgi:hypothetical protein
MAAKLRGEPPNRLLQAWKEPPLRQLGTKQGREVALHLGELAAFWLAAECRDPGRSLAAAFAEAKGLAPLVLAWAGPRDPAAEPPPAFVVIGRGGDPTAEPQRFSCRDGTELAEAVRALAEAGVRHLTVLNLPELVLDVFAAWHVATGTAAGYLARLRAELTPAEVEEAAARVALFQERLGHGAAGVHRTGNGTVVLACQPASVDQAAELRVVGSAGRA